jgi:hypothetical protein
MALLLGAFGAAPLHAQCTTTRVAQVAALEQFVWYNRLGANAPDALMFALEQDVQSSTGGAAVAGNAQLRPGKRPRPLVLRVNAGQCLQITLRNLLSPVSGSHPDTTRAVSIHVNGMQLKRTIADDGSAVQANASSLVEPGSSRTYILFAEKEGTFLLYSTAQMTGGEGDGGQIDRGLFGAVNVEPAGAEYYRSQVTNEDMRLASLDGAGVPQFASGYPKISYTAVYPAGNPLAGRPILSMLKGDTIVHSDISAIITGPNRGNFADSVYANAHVPVYPDRVRPFREHTVIFHDEVGLVQAFDSIYRSDRFRYTLQGGRDAFAINYGTGGIGSEILANRFGLGPMARCNDCKFEEFFLSSWAVGDPAMVVNVPSAASFSPSNPPVNPAPATKALYPDDPSNVFHSYIDDHVKIRNLHAGPKEHHIFHLHAHQWLNTPNDSLSNYKDSQAIGPGNGFTYEITYGGSGNRNDTPGDAIFHCHFYPHFAQGMWGLWRNHDVFEGGTVLNPTNGKPVAGARALPDAEIVAGTPIPAVVPMPTYALAPLPTDSMPGYPFYIPGVAGHRPPQPPMDLAFDGGLPRHVVTGGVAVFPALNTRDFSKRDSLLTVTFLPDSGTVKERAAMRFHSQLGYTTPIANAWTTTGLFETNGLPPAPGAPYADPCGLRGVRMGDSLDYKAAGFQLTAYYNKARWSYSQHRMFGLWADVPAFIAGTKAPEPLFFRAHNNSCLTYHLVNLIPAEYNVDDFQVQTPTDIIGQHIHLVKFDVTSSDGAANGWNYEDGALAPDAVRASITAIRRANGCVGLNSGDPRDGTETCPKARFHPNFTTNAAWKGAQENLQRWWVDPVPRGGVATSALPTIFTHDHFGPSSHQQTGLYAGLLPEDSGTVWRDPETGANLGGRTDGGPTSWRADILYANKPQMSYREFGIQIADYTFAYGKEGLAAVGTAASPINPPGRDDVGLPYLLRPPRAANKCPNDSLPPCPEIVSSADPGTMVINYRNEPLALRVRDPAGNSQPADSTGDLSLAYSSKVVHRDVRLDSLGPYAARPGVLNRDPFTPMMRTYEDDRILIRLLVGAHEEGHNWGISGTRWLFERLAPNSGFRSSQMAGISEWEEFSLNPLMANRRDTIADFMYRGGSSVDDQWNGQWGVIRAYRKPQANLFRLDTGRPVSSSRDAAVKDSAAGRFAMVEGASSFAAAKTFPDPNDTTTWGGDIATLEASNPTVTPAQRSALDAGTATPSDSVQAGYGTASGDGLDMDLFEYDPDAGQETVATSDAAATSKSASFHLQQDATATSSMRAEAAAAPDGGATSTTTVYKSSPGALDVGFYGVCPRLSHPRVFEISAIPAALLPRNRLTYNTRTTNGGPLYDPTAVVYVFDADLVKGGLKRNPEPLVLRANAGDCIMVRLRNRLPSVLPDSAGYNTLPMIVDKFNANQVNPSARVGLHAQLVSLDVQRSDGSAVGVNDNTTVLPGRWRWYQWYAGTVYPLANGHVRATPAEFGAINLTSSDRVKHSNKGAIAGLIVEPPKTHWTVNPNNRDEAVILRNSDNGVAFREGVTFFQNDVNLRFGSAVTLPAVNCASVLDVDNAGQCAGSTGIVSHTFAAGSAVPNLAGEDDAEDSGQKGLNYRTEPLWFRKGFAPDADLGYTANLNFRTVLQGDSAQTPIFTATAGDSLRLRVLEPGGHSRNSVFVLHGHVWEQEPYADSSRTIAHNPYSEWKGARDGHGPGDHFEVIPRNRAGGKYHVAGDYLFRDMASFTFDGGIWGILRVLPSTTKAGTTPASEPAPATIDQPSSACTIDPNTGETVCN